MLATDAHALDEFYTRLRKSVFAFCRMFLGDGPAAEELTCEVLVTCYRSFGSRFSDGELLPRAIAIAVRATQEYRPTASRPLQFESALEAAIQSLPRMERMIVIMRNLLHMDWESVALATELPRKQAHEVWARGIFQLNESLHRNLAKEHR